MVVVVVVVVVAGVLLLVLLLVLLPTKITCFCSFFPVTFFKFYFFQVPEFREDLWTGTERREREREKKREREREKGERERKALHCSFHRGW